MRDFDFSLGVGKFFTFRFDYRGGGSGHKFFVGKLGLDAALKSAVVLDFFLGFSDFGFDVDVVGGHLDAELKGSGPKRKSAFSIPPLGVGELGYGGPCGGFKCGIGGERRLEGDVFLGPEGAQGDHVLLHDGEGDRVVGGSARGGVRGKVEEVGLGALRKQVPHLFGEEGHEGMQGRHEGFEVVDRGAVDRGGDGLAVGGLDELEVPGAEAVPGELVQAHEGL